MDVAEGSASRQVDGSAADPIRQPPAPAVPGFVIRVPRRPEAIVAARAQTTPPDPIHRRRFPHRSEVERESVNHHPATARRAAMHFRPGNA